jgi:BASS family bile acid:Na+ symporter
VDVLDMMVDILKMVILPIVLGLGFNRLFYGKAKWLDEAMPVVSMVGIAFIITIITAAGRNSLLTIGATLIVAVLIHNMAGYFLGYWSARLLRLDERSCRTVAIEVGMQNGGLASAIALQMGKVATVGLAPAVFGPLMNITGSTLATWWGSHPPPEPEPVNPETEKAKITT